MAQVTESRCIETYETSFPGLEDKLDIVLARYTNNMRFRRTYANNGISLVQECKAATQDREVTGAEARTRADIRPNDGGALSYQATRQ